MDCLFNLIALLRAVQVVHHHAHWTTRGPSFVGDHELFGELYTAIDPQFDSLAEKAIAEYGPEVVDMERQLGEMLACVSKWNEIGDLVERSLAAEDGLQKAIATYRRMLEEKDELPLWLDNFLAQLADDHKTAVYKLQQRNG